ncbi:lytic transglycosylase domain-containing protein [Roseovarius sp. CAU 1744]|uniref:lytic transglycosylase domain-containing protein n=1 Tax=Roseovarius sp. CAU 1744 TaxID=3140368 RepID=UPI00325BF180
MSRLVTQIMVLLCLSLPGWAAEPGPRAPRPLESAFHAIQADRWDVAANLAARDGPAAADLIEWYRLRSGRGDAQAIQAFLDRNPDWPALDYLRRRNELRMIVADHDAILKFYAAHAPQTGIGALTYAGVLMANGRQEEAEATIVTAWRTMDLTTEEHNAFMEAYEGILKPHHVARMHMAAWRGLKDVKLMKPLVSADLRKRIETRQTIENGRKALDKWIAALPAKLRRDAHVAYAEFNHLMSKRKTDSAIKLMLRQSRIDGGLGDPHRWSNNRRSLARAQMRAGNHQMAYDLASVHQLSGGSRYADLEWLSGYLALRFLNQPELALDHFQRLRAAVVTPISLGRAGYWIGRAQEALNDPEAAQIAYAEGAQHPTSFYGILAAERANIPLDPMLDGKEFFAPWREAGFTSSSVFQAGVLAIATGRITLAEQFFVHLSQSLDREELGQLAHALDDLGQPHLQVMVGKAAARRAIVLPSAYYALHPLAQENLPVPAELSLTIARRESEFDLGVVSGAGAQGLMQLMPGTAKEVAGDLGLAHSRTRVLEDWRYNVALGSTYLAQLADWLDGNLVLMSVGYNAGPGRARQWIEAMGDPRTSDVDIIDWIEHIPFRETRNYVMRVTESMPVYRARLGKDPLPIPFSEELKGKTIRPDRRTIVSD